MVIGLMPSGGELGSVRGARPQGPFILTFDIGTTACKTVLFSAPDGEVVAEAEQEYPTRHPKPLWAEQDPDDWWRAVVATARRVVATARGEGPAGAGMPAPPAAAHAGPLLAIGLSSQRETVVPLDGAGRKVADAILWMDRRAALQAAELERRLGRDRLQQETGMIPDSTFTATKLLWLRQNDPETFGRARLYLQPKEYVAYRLTGVPATEPSLASRTMMWDVRRGRWWEPAFEAIGLPIDRMPPVIPSSGIVGRLTAEAAAALGIPPEWIPAEGVAVVAGGGDRQCEALGAGIGPAVAMESTGTTSNLSLATGRLPERLDSRAVYSAHVLPGHWLIEQGMTTSGSILRWFRDRLAAEEREEARRQGRDPYELISEAAAQSPVGAGGLVLLPFFMGAKATRWNPAARGVLFGLTLEHDRGDIARAILEGVALELRACVDVLEGMGLAPKRVVAMGGGAKGRLWLQIKADVLGLPVGLLRSRTAASLGAFLLAASALGLVDDPLEAARRLNPVVQTLQPDAGRRKQYDEVYGRYEALYRAVEPLFG